MQIALTKKLSGTMKIDPPFASEYENQLFCWTANWTNVWNNRKTEDMLVLVNDATRFTVAIYQVKRKNLKNAAGKMRTAIANTLLSMNLNPEIVEEYMRRAGALEFVRNRSRQAASWVTKAGLECAFHVADMYDGVDKMFSDTVGASVNYEPVNYSGKNSEAFLPYEAMFNALSKLTGKPTYNYRAFELLVTLKLEVYQATRRIIVPADLRFSQLHRVLQSVFDWKDCHLFDFAVYANDRRRPTVRLVPSEEDLEFDENAVLMEGHVLSEFFPKCKSIHYTYDMGDNWEHEIQLVRVIDGYDKESPRLLEAVGQTPPEDVGGVAGFLNFRRIMLNPSHPEYAQTKEWAEYWTPELSEWQRRPRVLHV